MTFTAYGEMIRKEVKAALEAAGLVDGDLTLEKEIDVNRTYFFELLNARKSMQDRTYVLYQWLNASRRQYHDNRMFGGQEVVAIVINTAADVHSKEIVALSDEIENAFDSKEWQINGRTSSADPLTGMKQVTFSISKVFSRK